MLALALAIFALIAILIWKDPKQEEIPPAPQFLKQKPIIRHPEFLQRAQERDIQYLVHFTRLENLQEIARRGLISRKNLDAANANYIYNDKQRMDNLRDTISLSVTFPNYRMFYKYKKSAPDANWAMILLDAEKVLAELDCAFNFANASSNSVKSIPIARRMTLDAFDKMFYEPEKDSRFNRNLRDNEPTDPQAEILCFDKIPVDFFSKIVFENNSALQVASEIFNGKNVPCAVENNYFAPRHDYRFWKA